MTKIIIPFFAFACMLGGVSAQTTRDGDLRECTGLGWNTCDRWKHCNWWGSERDGECYNDCPLINTGGDELGTTRDCRHLQGCDLVGRSGRCDFTRPLWSAEAYVNIQNYSDHNEDEDEAAQSTRGGPPGEPTPRGRGNVSKEVKEKRSGDSIYISAGSSRGSGGSSFSNEMGTGQDTADSTEGGRKSYLRQSRL